MFVICFDSIAGQAEELAAQGVLDRCSSPFYLMNDFATAAAHCRNSGPVPGLVTSPSWQVLQLDFSTLGLQVLGLSACESACVPGPLSFESRGLRHELLYFVSDRVNVEPSSEGIQGNPFRYVRWACQQTAASQISKRMYKQRCKRSYMYDRCKRLYDYRVRVLTGTLPASCASSEDSRRHGCS